MFTECAKTWKNVSTLKYGQYKNLICLVQAGLVQTKFNVVKRKTSNNNLEWRQQDGHGGQTHGSLKKIRRTMTYWLQALGVPLWENNLLLKKLPATLLPRVHITSLVWRWWGGGSALPFGSQMGNWVQWPTAQVTVAVKEITPQLSSL